MTTDNGTQILLRRLGILLCFWLFGLILTALIIGVLSIKMDMGTVKVLRVMTVIQDILMFITPAALTSVFASRDPMGFLRVDRGVTVGYMSLMLVTLLASIPAMNLIVEWNAAVSLPEGMSAIEQWMRASETRSAEMIDTMLSGTTVKDLVISVLIVGVLTGLSEELFFRGILQRILSDRVNIHAAIWITAAVFSAVHFQFYGFVPRLLLGGFFGYLAWWGRSLWLPITAHAVNNTLVVVARWCIARGDTTFDPNLLGTGGTTTDTLIAAASAAVTAIGIALLIRYRHRD
ncbi:MAG: CPBP family intramembrane metalloprotease [Pseudoflavonifractor sp.]|nr:CPBP family intramembrane metalloprotease [Pseudoflavonifractor sp.]